MFLSTQELDHYSNGLLNELGNDREVLRACESNYKQLKRFHNDVESSLRILDTGILRHLGEILSFHETTFASSFKRQLDDYRTFQDTQQVRAICLHLGVRTLLKTMLSG